MTITATLTGTAQLKAQLRLAEQGAAAANAARGIVATTVVYAPYVEKARGFLGGAVAQFNQDAFAQALGEAIWQGPSAVRRVFTGAVTVIRSQAQSLAPVRTGRLRGSLYGKVESR